MNKYQEALDYVNKSVCTAMACLGINDKKTRKCLHTLQGLVNKETPIKIVCKKSLGFYRTHCPKCDIAITIASDYCPNCGQKLDWSE